MSTGTVETAEAGAAGLAGSDVEVARAEIWASGAGVTRAGVAEMELEGLLTLRLRDWLWMAVI